MAKLPSGSVHCAVQPPSTGSALPWAARRVDRWSMVHDPAAPAEIPPLHGFDEHRLWRAMPIGYGFDDDVSLARPAAPTLGSMAIATRHRAGAQEIGWSSIRSAIF
jgi:hypothetical protein